MADAGPHRRMKGEPRRARWLALGGVALVSLVLTFAVGVLVGRQLARHPETAQAVAEPVKRAGPVPRRSGLAELAPERSVPQEKLTFYQTLTAPLGTVPASGKAEVSARPEAPRPRPVSEHPPAPERAGPSAPPVAAPRADKPGPVGGPPTAPRAGEARPGDWAVQVGAFKDRGQAESVRRPLTGAGLEAYLTTVPGEDGQMRYRVRVGGFKTREEAARMVDRLRQERSLTAFVTPR